MPPLPQSPSLFFFAPLVSCPLQSANAQLSWVTRRVPDGREVMIPASTTDGSVAARWKHFDCAQLFCLHFFPSHLFTLRPCWTSHLASASVPFQNCRSVLSAVTWGGCRKVNRAPFCLSICDNWLKALCVALKGYFMFN